MKLIETKYLLILFGALLVLFLSFAYMSYGVVIEGPVPKSPAEVIDSMRNELQKKDSEIKELKKQLNAQEIVQRKQ